MPSKIRPAAYCRTTGVHWLGRYLKNNKSTMLANLLQMDSSSVTAPSIASHGVWPDGLSASCPRAHFRSLMGCLMRYLMHRLRMLAYRTALALARQLAPPLSKPETAHEVVRNTPFTLEACLVLDHQEGILKLLLVHESRTCLDKALDSRGPRS